MEEFLRNLKNDKQNFENGFSYNVRILFCMELCIVLCAIFLYMYLVKLPQYSLNPKAISEFSSFQFLSNLMITEPTILSFPRAQELNLGTRPLRNSTLASHGFHVCCLDQENPF